MKYGGHGKPAEPRNEHNFAFSSLLQNVFVLYLSTHAAADQIDEDKDAFVYSDFCTRLADELFQLAIDLDAC